MVDRKLEILQNNLDACAKERHFFLLENNKQIYCVEYLPDENLKRNIGVILCKPIWGERIRTHSIFTNLARELASIGFTIITCDYYGDGNSGGETTELSFSSMVNDIVSLNKYLIKNYQIKEFVVLGLLIGANVAAIAEKKITGIEKMVLFEPQLNPIDNMKKILRTNLSSQMVVHKKIIKNREKLIEDLKNNIPVNVDGFMMSKDFWESYENISPFKLEHTFNGPVSIFSFVKKGRKGKDYADIVSQFANGKFKTIEQEFDWTGWKSHIPTPLVFFKVIRDELLNLYE